MSIQERDVILATRPEWKGPSERAQEEFRSRSERLERLRGKVIKLFPSPEQADLRSEIERSFHVPQWGEYHNEGVLMDRHLEEMLRALETIESGEMPEYIPASEREAMQKIAIRHHEALQRYVFLHDISKADLLRVEIQAEMGQKKGKAWEGTLEEWYEEHGIEPEIRIDPARLFTKLNTANLKGISYYNQGIEMASGRKTKSLRHGEDGKMKLEKLGNAGVSPAMLEAIERHEVAYQFESVKVDTYKKYFESLSPDERDLAMVASFVDTMGSWRKDGKPDLRNFLFLLDSKHNYETIQALEKFFSEGDIESSLDKKKAEAFFLALYKQNGRLHETSVALQQRLLRECRFPEYDVERLRFDLEELVRASKLTQDEVDEIVTLVQVKDVSAIGKRFVEKMKNIAVALKASEKVQTP